MRRNIKIKPSRQASIPGFIGGIIFVLIGIFIVIPEFGLFGFFWTSMAVGITITNGINVFSEKGIPSEEIYIESDGYHDRNFENNINQEKELDFEEKLRKLKSLRDDGIISEIEYEAKRIEILNKIK